MANEYLVRKKNNRKFFRNHLDQIIVQFEMLPHQEEDTENSWTNTLLRWTSRIPWQYLMRKVFLPVSYLRNHPQIKLVTHCITVCGAMTACLQNTHSPSLQCFLWSFLKYPLGMKVAKLNAKIIYWFALDKAIHSLKPDKFMVWNCLQSLLATP